MAYSIDVLNNIRANASDEYQNRIPEATRTNIASIGQAFETYTLLYNEFAAALVNKIGKTIIEQKMFKNRLARFKSGAINTEQDVEEIFVEMASAEGAYDKDGANPLGRRNPPDVKVIYHRMNRRDKYVVSVGDVDFIRVFRSPETLDVFMKGIINSIYSGDQYDEWVAMKNVLATYESYFDYEVPSLSKAGTGDKFAKTFVKALRKAVNDLSFPSTAYNAAGVKTWTESSDLVLLVNKDVVVEADVEMLATAFHQSQTDMKVVPTIVVMDDFGTLTDTYALLVDKDFFRVYDTLSRMEPQRNADGLFTNYFYHHWQILSASTFKNAVRFKAVNS